MATHMTIENVIQRSCINLHLAGSTKEEIILEMTDMFLTAGVISSRELFLQDVYRREKEGPTGIGNQVAIPHGKSDAVLRTSMAVGRSDQGVEWETLGEGKSRAFVMFAVNTADKSELVSLLSQVAVALCDDKVIETLLLTEDEEEIFTLFNQKEGS
ncbi:PTS sugar transporter subunit IIA [Lachnospiraceae bacterium 54-53]